MHSEVRTLRVSVSESESVDLEREDGREEERKVNSEGGKERVARIAYSPLQMIPQESFGCFIYFCIQGVQWNHLRVILALSFFFTGVGKEGR